MASALNESASKMDQASAIEIEMRETQGTSGHSIEHSIIDRQPTEETHHLDIEEGTNVISNGLPDLSEESGSQGNDEVNRAITNVL